MAKILIVDDRQVNREFLSTLLSYQNHHLLEAGLASEGLAIIRTEYPDLVIADILMPEIDGFEFVRQIRAIPEIAATRVIFYSANYVESEARALAKACGVEHVIAKPSEPEQILKMVQEALGITPPPASTVPSAEFDRAHQRLLIDKLAQKVNELESLNTNLEQRVKERTAELAEANQRLRELHTFKDNLLMIASHDLRSPLSVIQSIATMILENPVLPESTHCAAQTIISSAKQLNTLVADILDISSLEAGKVVLEPIIIQIGFIIDQVIENFRYSAQFKQIQLHVEVSPQDLVVFADWNKLSQVFNNLIGNAIKFTPNGGRVSVTIKREGSQICIEVADNGIGIPNEAIPHIFEKFQRAHPAGTNNERGSGLGLTIVQQLVELHGGRIEVCSQVGLGSTFRVYLPAI